MGCFFDWGLWELRCASDRDLLWSIAGVIAASLLVVLALSFCLSPPRREAPRAKAD
jgi:lipopolysaccharide export LptBFGC system permease protein LptF